MSKAFVREAEHGAGEELPERPVSPHPNYVTARGLAAIEREVERLQAALADQEGAEDRAVAQRLARDLRYWMARKMTAQLVDPPASTGVVQFGSRVTIARPDGRRQTFRIVGEDEADPAQGSVSYVSPMGAALLRREEGEAVTVAGARIEILAVE